MSDLPSPLTPAECDLRGFPFMPMMISQLKQSRSWLLCKRNPALAFYLINLWTAAWHGTPAASLEDDDLVLADIAMCDDATWTKIRDEALRGWVRCSDGRIYHPIVAERARDAWDKKNAQKARTEAARRAREEGRRTSVTGSVTENATASVTASNREGEGEGDNRRSSSLRSEDPPPVDQARGELSRPRPAKPPRKHPYPPDAFDRWYRDYPHKVGRAAAVKAFTKVQASDSVPFEALITGLQRYMRTKPPDRPWCNPATWLNEGRWADEPARSPTTTTAANGGEHSIDLGGGNSAKPSVIRDLWSRGRWPPDWGPDPNQPGCRIPAETMAQIMDGRQAA